jgi:hypothetical protein
MRNLPSDECYRRLESLPARYPETDIQAAFQAVVELYIGRHSLPQMVLQLSYPPSLVIDIYGILIQALQETGTDDGSAGAAVGSTPRPVAPTLKAGDAKLPPLDVAG